MFVPDGMDPELVSEDEPEKIKCWGSNTYGELVLNDKTSRGVSWSQMGDNLPFVDFKSRARSVGSGWTLTVSPELSYPEPYAEWQAPNNTVVPVIENVGIRNWTDDLQFEKYDANSALVRVVDDGSAKKTAGNASYPVLGWAVGSPGTIRTWVTPTASHVITDVFTTSELVVIRTLIPEGNEITLNWDLSQFSVRRDLNFDAAWRDVAQVVVYERLYPAGTHAFEINGDAYFLFCASDLATIACREQQPADLPRAAAANTTYVAFYGEDGLVPWRVESDFASFVDGRASSSRLVRGRDRGNL